MSRIGNALGAIGAALDTAARIARAASAAAGAPGAAATPAPVVEIKPVDGQRVEVHGPAVVVEEGREAPSPEAVAAAQRADGEQRFGLDPKASQKLTSTVAIADDTRPLTSQVQRVAYHLRPPHVTATCIRADNGYMQRANDLLDDLANRDLHLRTVMSRRENAPGALSWQVIPTSDRPKALRIAAFVERVLRELGEVLGPDGEELRDLGTTVCHMNGAVTRGYAVAEMLWERQGRFMVPIGALHMPARRFIFSQFDASLRWWDETNPYTPYPGVDLRTFPSGRFLQHRPRVTGGVGPREGLFRPLLWGGMFRCWSLGDWLREGELAWKPYRIAQYDSGKNDPEDKRNLELALESLTSNGWALIPKETVLKLEYVKNATGQSMHKVLCDFLGAEMSKLLLGATLTVEQGKTGAMALGNVHAAVARELLEVDARSIEATIRRCLIAPLVWRNFGKFAAVPEFRFLTDEGQDLGSLSEAIQRLVDAGLKVPSAWVRAQFGIPEPEPGEEVMSGASKAEIAMAPGGGAPVPQDETTEPGSPYDGEPGDTAEGGDDGGDPADGGELVAAVTMERLRKAFHLHRVLVSAGVRRPRMNHNLITLERSA